jgi:osmotically-inducible protein OsmY
MRVKQKAERAAETAVEKGRDALETAREKGKGALESARDIGRDVVGSAATAGRETLDTALEKGRDVVEVAAEKGRDAVDRAKEYTPANIRRRRRRAERRQKVKSTLTGIGAGAAIVYFFDPQSGKRRRAVARDRITALVRRGARSGARLGRYAASEGYGLVQRVRHTGNGAQQQLNDVTLARKVESEVLGSSPLKGRVNVNAENGTVVLRGQATSADEIRELEERVRNVDGVRDVRNLLTLAEAPTTTG